jgi:inosine/guanosine/xanthosine phosphorylase family protein
MGPGELMLVTDHINWPGISPLVGLNDDTIGPRFVDVSQAYDPTLQKIAQTAATETGITLHEGVYVWCLGPNFETPAEIRAFRKLGADAVGMSTVPECLAAVHCGLRVMAIAVVTNLAAGMQKDLSHVETMTVGSAATPKLSALLGGVMKRLALDY